MSAFQRVSAISSRAVIIALTVPLAIAFAPAPASAQELRAPSTSASEPSHESLLTRYGALTIGMVSAATWNQLIDQPKAWPRTWSGYGMRLGDQVGFAVAEESLRALLVRAVPWESPLQSCPSAARTRALPRRAAGATSCAFAGTFTAFDAAGVRRANVPLLGAVVGASAVSLAWRPERESASKGAVFTASRIGIVLGGTVATRAWRQLRAERQVGSANSSNEFSSSVSNRSSR